MKVDLGIWDKLTHLVVFLCFIAILLLVGVWYLPLIHQNENMRKYILGLDTRIQQQVETSKQLQAGIRALNDPKAVTRLARESLHYAKPGETVIIFGATTTNHTAQR
jgi:cell division protein FtsB